MKSNYITWLIHTVESMKCLQNAPITDVDKSHERINQLTNDLFDVQKWAIFREDLYMHIDENGYTTNSSFWKLLNQELKKVAKLQSYLLEKTRTADSFYNYAEVYDEIIGKPCFDEFMGNYMSFFLAKYAIDFSNATLLSVGCGTGIMELYMQENLGINPEKLLGIDISEAMIKVASERINAEIGNVLTLEPRVKKWDSIFCGLNVLQYVNHKYLEDAIQKIAQVLHLGGYFFGDFITSDHIRCYPNVISSQKTISLRTPKLVEKNNFMYQQSEIINVRCSTNQMIISYEGVHERFLPPLNRMRGYFKNAFGGKVDIYDAVNLKPISENEDTCASTRYLICAQKA